MRSEPQRLVRLTGRVLAHRRIKMLATGLGIGILLDATIIRALLVPAIVSLLGRWNWRLPPAPARLPRVRPSLPHPEPVN
jgi:RND superfamily putative drug exporter